ncbi:ketopantoate reductase family protein [Mordavella massiliensis]|uniref:2-dehydropantoate 2-reductase n=1 Tax=Mordavella massiliensis TaxID=1871024 RepID=A0A938XB21_9CLOT|nr:ketopantoate reductase family protein [Mordavella massiliensis]MBM6948181.1 ketopantoate reductase family protein [Mordavella massiliensis]
MIQKTAIIGMGALGLLYADIIASAKGPAGVSFVMDRERLEKYRGMVFDCNGQKKTFPMECCEDASPADLVIVAVKYNGLAAALDTMKNCVGKDTVILSVMNGISSEKIIGERYGHGRLIDTVAQGMDAMKFGSRLTYTKRGELRIGAEDESQEANLRLVAAYFDEIGMPYTVEKDILHRLWGKFMLNVGVNQTCMAYETNYGGALAEGSGANRTMLAAMREVIALANAEGIRLSEQDLDEYVDILKTLSPEGMPSMRQDAVSKRPTEVEMFAGTVIPMAGAHGIPVPANVFLYETIKKMEQAYT